MDIKKRIKARLAEAEEKKRIQLQTDQLPIVISALGRKFEERVFGVTLKYLFRKTYVDFISSYEEMKEIQPKGYDPSNPSGGLTPELFRKVQGYLPVGCDLLKLFISLGTMLDFWHGVDAAFEWKQGVRVTIDATMDEGKIQKFLRRDYLRCHPWENHVVSSETDNRLQEGKQITELDTLIQGGAKADFCLSPNCIKEDDTISEEFASEVAHLLLKRYLEKPE